MKASKLNTYLITFLISIYVLFSPPFIFSEYIPFFVRVALELIPILFFLAVINRGCYQPFVLVSLGVWSTLVLMMLLYTESTISSVIYSYLKIIFFLLLIVILASTSDVFDLLKKVWFSFWLFISVSVIAGFCLYQLDLVSFIYTSFEDVTQKESYHYYSNVFFGNFIQSSMLGMPVPRMTWYLFEPSMLAFFFGVNVFLSNVLFSQSKYVHKFKWINLVAGFLTFSNTFIIFFMLYSIVKLFSHRFLRPFLYIIMPVVFITVTWVIYTSLFNSEAGESTSLADRLSRLQIAYYFIENNTVFSFLYGNGLGISTEVFGRGISSGILTIFVERGFLVFAFLVFIFYKYLKSNKTLLFFLLFYSLSFELTWYPLLLVAIGMSYVALRKAHVAVGDACEK